MDTALLSLNLTSNIMQHRTVQVVEQLMKSFQDAEMLARLTL